jgi:hypothetical protein
MRRDTCAAGLTTVLVAVGLLAGCAGMSSGTTPADDAAPPPPASDTGQPPLATPAETRQAVDVVAVATKASDTVVSAGGYVQGVIELGGTCSYTLTQGDATVTGRSDAEPDATTTWCANVDLTLPRPGEPWTLDVHYESPTSQGTGTATSDGTLS